MELSIYDTEALIKIAKNMKNKKKLKVLMELQSKPLALQELYSIFKNEIKYKDNLYRYLEDMVGVGILKKEYDVEKKRIMYSLDVDRIIINLKF